MALVSHKNIISHHVPSKCCLHVCPRYCSVYFVLFISFQFSCFSVSLCLYRVINGLMSLPPDLIQNKNNGRKYSHGSEASFAEVVTNVERCQPQPQYTLMRLLVED